jgi:hypothetical protein
VDISEKRWINNIIALTREYPNVYVDISNLNIFDDKIKGRLWRMLDLINECTNCPKSKECRQSYAHLKYKLIFGSDWYHTYFAKMKDDEGYMKDKRYTYDGYCYEFKRLFDKIDDTLKLPAGKFWERISLINPWRFYGFTNINEGKNKIQEMHDTLEEIYGIDPIYISEKEKTNNRCAALLNLSDYIFYTSETDDINKNTHKSYTLDECIHEKSKAIREGFGIDFYTELKKLLKDNLAENEDEDKNIAFQLFERMESELRVGRIDYIHDYVIEDVDGVTDGLKLSKHNTAGIYDTRKKRFHVNIEKDREGLEKYGNNDKYSITVHEMWHNIDYLAQQKIRSIHRCDVDTSYQCTLKGSADCFKTKARVFTHCKECDLYGHSQEGNGNCPLFLSGNDDCPEVKDKFQPFSYFYQCNLLGDAIKQDVERDGRERLCGNVLRRYTIILKNAEDENADLSLRLDILNALSHVFDILTGESYVYSYNNHYRDGMLNESYLFHPPKELDERPENYWVEEDREERLAIEYFANIGSLSGTNSAAFKELLKYFPKSYKVYNEIIKYIFYYLP